MRLIPGPVLRRLACFLVCLLWLPRAAAAQDMVVTSIADSGPGSLRQVLADALDGDVIAIGPELSYRTITLQSPLVIDKNLMIDASGAIGLQISGNDATRILDVGADGTACSIAVLMAGIRFVHGHTNGTPPDPGSYGGAIRTCAQVLQLDSVTIEDSITPERGGALYQTAGTTVITNSHLARNNAISGAALLIESGDLHLDHVTLSGNFGGSTIDLPGGGYATMDGVTMTGNSAALGPILAVNPGATLTITNSTMADNSVYSGFMPPPVISNYGDTHFANTIVANPLHQQCGGPVPVVDDGGSLQFGDTSCGLSITADPQLGTLGFYGDPRVPTIPIAATSPARDAGDNGLCLPTDARGLWRAISLADPCDIGAFEYDGPLAATVTTLADSGPGSLRQAVADAGSGAIIDFQPGLTGTLLLDSRLTLERAVTIQGPGVEALTIARNPSAVQFGLVYVDGTCDAPMVFRGFTMKDGDAVDERAGALDTCGPLTIEDVRFTHNTGPEASAVITCCNYLGAILNRVRFDGNYGGRAAFLGAVVTYTAIVDSSFIGNEDLLVFDYALTVLLRNVTMEGTGGPRFTTDSYLNALEQATIVSDVTLDAPHHAPISISSSILSGSANACHGSYIDSRGYNVIHGPCTGPMAGDARNIVGDPRLAPAAVNPPGTVVTRGLMLDSPAIDAADPTICWPTDARGVARTPSACDAGAFEAHPITLSALAGGGVQGMPFTSAIVPTGAYGAATFAVTSGTLPPGITLSTSGAITGTPLTGGSFGFTVTAIDVTGVGVRQAYTLAVDGAPLITGLGDTSITRNGRLGPIDLTVGDDFTSPGTLQLTATSSNQTLVPDAQITFGGTGTARTLTVTPLAHAFGTTTITVTVSDGLLTTTEAFTLTVMPVYALAEGSTGWFFDMDLLLANPNATPAPVAIRFLREDGLEIDQAMILAPTSRTTIRVDDIPGLESTALSTVITSTSGLPIVVERTMLWDASGYGSHTETASEGTASTWYFAEGSQGFFSTYFLLANPDAVQNTAHVTYLREQGPPLTRDYPLAPTSRRTVDAGAEPELVNTSFGAVVTFDRPGIAERSMYFGRNPLFSGGTVSMGATSPATAWFLAEGATGTFFNTFLLIANPSAMAPADVTIAYLPATGVPVTRTYVVAANQRQTINVALEDASLASAAVAARVESTVPIIVERSMYWPVPVWHEGHNSFGVTEAAARWGLAEGRVGGDAGYQTFILLANPGAQNADVTVTFLRSDGTTLVKTFTTPALTRLNVVINGAGSDAPELIDEAFGALIESTQPIVVERSVYSNANGIIWAAGSNATGTRLP